MKNLYSKVALSAVLISIGKNAYAQSASIDDLMNLSLKELTQIEVTSVSKTSEKANEAAAAITVVTHEDIRRSGANNLPEVLRIVPGVQVAQQDANKWIVTSRGFSSSSQFSNKMLVLIDGRSIYSPIFSGVLWEEQMTPLEDVERIEVIRGPGSALWGANAVNGIINIITKSASDTQDTLISSGFGTFERSNQYARHGGSIGEDFKYRAYVQHYSHDGSKNINESDRSDEWNTQRAGFKSEGKIDETQSFELQGDVYQGERDEMFDRLPAVPGGIASEPSTHDTKGANIVAKYSNQLSADSKFDLQLYYDYTSRDVSLLSADISTWDIDMQHSINIDENNEFIWGLGYRLIHGNESGSNFLRLSQNELDNTVNLFSGFVQDKIQLIPQELYLTVGSKFEHNTYSGFEIQPSARLAWMPEEGQTIWGAVSRAVRTPSQIERDLTQVLQGGAAFVTATDNDVFSSEELIAYEIGYRVQPTDNTALDIAAFYNDYDDLRTLEATSMTNFTPRNRASGNSSGIEVSAQWDVTKEWNLAAGYSYIDVDIKLEPGSTDVTNITQHTDGRTPQNMLNIRSHYDITDNISMDNMLYFYDDIKKTSIAAAPSIKEYVRFDTQLSYEPMDGVTLSLVGRNLLDDQHQEFIRATYNNTAEIPRSVFGKVTLRF